MEDWRRHQAPEQLHLLPCPLRHASFLIRSADGGAEEEARSDGRPELAEGKKVGGDNGEEGQQMVGHGGGFQVESCSLQGKKDDAGMLMGVSE